MTRNISQLKISYDLKSFFLMVMLLVTATLSIGIFLKSAINILTNDYSNAYVGYVMYMASDWSAMFTPLDQPPYVVTIYPPIYMVLVGTIDAVFNNIILTSRLVSILSGLAASMIVWKIVDVYSNDNNKWIPIIASLMFLTHPYIIRRSVAARPDMLAIAIMGTTLYIYISREGYAKHIGVGILVVLALFTKQNFIALPMALSLSYIVDHDWKHSAGWSASVIVSGLLILFLLTLATQGKAFEHLVLVNSSIGYDAFLFLSRSLSGLKIHVILVSLALLSILKWSDRIPNIILIYSITSAIPLLFLGKPGSGQSMFIEQIFALSIITGILLSNIISKLRHFIGKNNDVTILQIVLVILIISQFGMYIRGPATILPGAPEAETAIQDVEGPILSEDMVLSLKHDGENIYQSFIYAQLVESGYLKESPITSGITEKRYDRVIILSDICSSNPSRWTSNQVKAIKHNYQLVETVENYRIYKPKDGTQGSTTCGNNLENVDG